MQTVPNVSTSNAFPPPPSQAQIDAAIRAEEERRHRLQAEQKQREEEQKKRDEVRRSRASALTAQVHEAKTKKAVQEAVADALQRKDSADLRQASDQVRDRARRLTNAAAFPGGVVDRHASATACVLCACSASALSGEPAVVQRTRVWQRLRQPAHARVREAGSVLR